MLEVPAILLTCVAIFGYVNGRYLKLPLTVGLVLIALISAMLVASIDNFAPDAGITNKLKELINETLSKDGKLISAIDNKFSFDMKIYYPDTMNRILIDSGFDIIKLWGDYNKANFNEESTLQIYQCQIK